MTGKAVNSPKAGAGRHALPTKSGSCLPAALYPNITSAYPRTCGCRAKWRAKPNRRISTPVRSASLRTTRSVFCFILVSRPSSPWGLVFPSPSLVSGRGFQRRGPHLRPPSPGEGFQRERAAALALRVVGGPGRSRNALVLFFRGVGRVLFQKRMRPTSLRWKPSLAGAENYVKARGIAARFLVIRNHDGCPSKFQALRKGK